MNNQVVHDKQDIYFDNLEQATKNNTNYRNVIYTTEDGKMQLVLMSLTPGQEIGMEMHDYVDQFFRIESGRGKLITYADEDTYFEEEFSDGFAFIIPAGTYHNIINTSNIKSLKLYTIYTPPNHKRAVLQKTKPDLDEPEFGMNKNDL